MPFRIGLTGGIGSGKTVVADYFKKLGIDVIDADVIVHGLSQPGQSTFDDIVQHFGPQVLKDDGSLNREWLRERAFSNSKDKKALEDILHPAVHSTMQIQLTAIQSPYCLLVVPLMIETGFTDLTDRILVVMAAEKTRIERVRQRSGLSDEEVKAIIVSQATDEERLQAADDVINNDGALEALYRQVEALDRKYRELV